MALEAHVRATFFEDEVGAVLDSDWRRRIERFDLQDGEAGATSGAVAVRLPPDEEVCVSPVDQGVRSGAGQLVGRRDVQLVLGLGLCATGLGALARGGLTVGGRARPVGRRLRTTSFRLHAELGDAHGRAPLVLGGEAVPLPRQAIALRGGMVALLRGLEPGRSGLVAQPRHVGPRGGGAGPRARPPLVEDRIAAGLEISIGRTLVFGGARAVAVAPRLILIRPCLILIARRWSRSESVSSTLEAASRSGMRPEPPQVGQSRQLMHDRANPQTSWSIDNGGIICRHMSPRHHGPPAAALDRAQTRPQLVGAVRMR